MIVTCHKGRRSGLNFTSRQVVHRLNGHRSETHLRQYHQNDDNFRRTPVLLHQVTREQIKLQRFFSL